MSRCLAHDCPNSATPDSIYCGVCDWLGVAGRYKVWKQRRYRETDSEYEARMRSEASTSDEPGLSGARPALPKGNQYEPVCLVDDRSGG